MSEHRKERVSALVDGELYEETQSTIDEMLQTSGLKDNWASYHLISDTLQRQLPEAIDTGLAARISASIENEPHILAPAEINRNSFVKPVAGFAIAASVAVMAVLGIQQNQDAPAIQPQQVVSFNANSAVDALPARTVSTAGPATGQLRQVKIDARARMNSYLVNYNEYRTNSGFQGMLPYARTVSFENNK